MKQKLVELKEDIGTPLQAEIPKPIFSNRTSRRKIEIQGIREYVSF